MKISPRELTPDTVGTLFLCTETAPAPTAHSPPRSLIVIPHDVDGDRMIAETKKAAATAIRIAAEHLEDFRYSDE